MDAESTLRRVLRFASACLLSMLLALPVRADGDEYRELVRAAIAAQEAGRYIDAYELFAKANAITPNARTQRGMGVAAFQAGDHVQAIRDLEAALASTEKALDGELRQAVTDLLARARKLVGSYALEVSPPDAIVNVDGRRMHLAPDLVLAPGRHTLEVSAEGFLSQTLTVNVQAGASDTLRVTLESAPLELTAPAMRLPSAGPDTTPATRAAPQKLATSALRRGRAEARERRSRRAMWGLLGSGAGLTVAATTMGVMGFMRAKPIDEACKAGCSEEARAQKIDNANLEGLAMGVNVAASAAAATLLAGTGVWAWRRYSVNAHVQRHSLHVGATLRF